MTSVFGDTSFYVALLSPADECHEAAASQASVPGLRVVTTDFVLIELSNFYAESSRRTELARMIDAMLASRTTAIIPASRALFRKGLTLFRSRPDKAWSLTDCTSFVVMAQRRIKGALTADRHFEQAGFRALLR